MDWLDSIFTWISDSSIASAAVDIGVDAAVGAVVGGAVSAATGGSFSDGAKIGALGGLAYGVGDKLMSDSSSVPDTTWKSNSTVPESPASELSRTSGISADTGKDPSLAVNDTSLASGGNGAVAQSPGLLGSAKTWFNNMTPAQGQLIGNMASGLGQGLLSMQTAKDIQEQKDLEYERNKKKVQPGIRAKLAALSGQQPMITRSV